MPYKISIPPQLRKFTGNQDVITFPDPVTENETLGRLLKRIELDYPGIHDRVIDPNGSLRRHVAVFICNNDARTIAKEIGNDCDPVDVPIMAESEIAILAANSGG